ncbi:MAG: putative DNA binding domain-containing protein [Bacteroidales bacterium]|nr:putative DNA binding domain-containing protein [Bacteroidales bacterium]
MIDENKALELIAQGEGQHVEFKESVPSKVRELSEEVCAFSNASGGYVLIGVNNKSGFVKGFTIDNTKRSSIQDSLDAIQPAVDCGFYPLTVQGHDIWVIEVQEGDNKPYVASGSIYVRRGANSQKLRTPAEMRQLFDDAGALHFDEAFNKWFRMDEVSEQAVREFKEKAGISSAAPAPELIRNLELLGPKGEMTNVVPMFFSDECGKRIPQAVVRCVLFKGTNKVHIIDSKTIGGPLLSQYNETTKWLKQRLAVEYIMDGFNPRIEKWEIPLDAIKEALTNSICHRDYYDTAANIMVELYDDRLEITNPGGLLPIVAKNFGHMSKSRNPKVFELFTRMDLVEKVGSGIPRMSDLMKEAGLPAPEYRTEGFFTTVLYKNKNTVKETGKKTIKETGKKMPERILEIIGENPQITVSDIAERCGLTYNGAYYHIEKMRNKGILLHKGGDKGGEWVIL